MTFRRRMFAATALLLVAAMSGGPMAAGAQDMTDKIPEPTVPELFTALGSYVRVAYNNEGFATLGYRAVQNSVGQDWILLEVGITVNKGTKTYRLKREDLTLKISDGTTIPLATQKQFLEANGLPALNQRAKIQTDSINYFPVEVTRAVPLNFFAQLGGGPRDIARDSVELSSNRVAMGRVFFKVPGGIKTGQYWLNIQFEGSGIEVPFRVFTKEENKEFTKNWQDYKKAHEASWGK